MLRRFFRHVEVVGLEHLPAEGGAVLVAWHPNGLVDPGLIITNTPRQVIFGARDGLFRVPILGQMMKAVGTVPIYRAMDKGRAASPDERRSQNDRSLDALAEQVAKGSFSCLFPEGTSHDSPHLLEIKTGAARFWYRARWRQPEGSPTPAIIPVGLHYRRKRGFRSRVLVEFHAPLDVPEFGLLPSEDTPEEVMKPRYRKLTDIIEGSLHGVVHATEDWEMHHLMHRARKLVRAERAKRAGADPGATDMAERTLGFARVWSGYYQRKQTHPEAVDALLDRVREYDADLRALGLEDHELDHPGRMISWSLAGLLFWQLLLVYVLLPPMLVIGFAVNLPPLVLLWALTKKVSTHRKDEATLKLMFGLLVFPATWALFGWSAAALHEQLHAWYPTLPYNPVLVGLVAAASAFTGGLVALRYTELAHETSRTLRIRLTRSRRRIALARLKVERSELFDLLIGMTEGLSLPGDVADDGRIVRERGGATAFDDYL